MGTPWSNEAKALLRFLSDREWHSWNDAVTTVAATVPPGKALRWYENRLMWRRRNAGTQVEEIDRSEDERIIFGQRGIAERCMQGLKRRNLDVEGERDNKRVRLRPGVDLPMSVVVPPFVGASGPLKADRGVGHPAGVVKDPGPSEPAVESGDDVVEDLADVALETEVERATSTQRIDEPEPAVEPPPPAAGGHEMALFDEQEIRRLVRDEMAQALDSFQTGFQSWLMEQFAQLEVRIGVSRSEPSPYDWASFDGP